MKKFITLLTIVSSFFTLPALAQSKGNAIVGEWMSPKKDSKFEIYASNNKYYGKIIWGSGAATTDQKNPDEKLRNRPLIGLVMLTDFVFDGDDTWGKGTIYDPREGKYYSCKLTLKSPNELNVRGFVGISLFGRSEIWTRIK